MSACPELLAPAGNWECARAAAANGADAIYFGLPRFNARLRADNFTEEDLPAIADFCYRTGMRSYAAFNTLVFTDELEDAANYLRLLSRAGIDALIVQDVGLVKLAREIVPDLAIHASTQMTITSPEGVRFARNLGAERVVLARETSLRELAKFDDSLPLEVFVHGALCVAYSGQCLTSESLGQRSANRGECAQACRMPYELVVDGAIRDLGDRRYLLSPQDLAAVNEIPALIAAGVASFKIEGRLKSPEYVAAVTQVYRKAIDAALGRSSGEVGDSDRYRLEMTFSRGLYSGWMHGVDHQALVPARFGKKRGPLAGRIAAVYADSVEIDDAQVPLRAGDGVVFDTGRGDTDREQGGRLYEVRGRRLFFERGRIDFSLLRPGDRIWKTDDPALNHELRKSFSGKIASRNRTPVDLRISGRAGEPLVVQAGELRAISGMPLQEARTAPLTTEKLRQHLGRLGETAYTLGRLDNALAGKVILPIAELNLLRREIVRQLEASRAGSRRENARPLPDILAETRSVARRPPHERAPHSLAALCRTMDQLEAALECDVPSIYLDFEDIRRYAAGVNKAREHGGAAVFLATPRIQKAGEEGFFKLLEKAEPDGVLIRNLGAIEYFQQTSLQRIGDFSLNVANPLSAGHFIRCGLDRLTVSYDLTISQVLALLRESEPAWFELTIHQHMPMFHMEHCVFAAFLSKGRDYTDCGRPCELHRVELRDRVGMKHPLRADVGCRNTLFNAVPQTGAGFFGELQEAGLRHYRVELLTEDKAGSVAVLQAYQALLAGRSDGERLGRQLKAQSQLGVTQGTYADR